ncbi:hypothetical protein D3C80_1776250 [compost metagenome]
MPQDLRHDLQFVAEGDRSHRLVVEVDRGRNLVGVNHRHQGGVGGDFQNEGQDAAMKSVGWGGRVLADDDLAARFAGDERHQFDAQEAMDGNGQGLFDEMSRLLVSAA